MGFFKCLKVGQALPQRSFESNEVQLFLYNAAIWNAHRIHYDYKYAIDEEHYSGLVIDGPLMGDWLTQLVLDWLDIHGELVEFEYSNRKVAYLGEVLKASGKVDRIDEAQREAYLDLSISNQSGEVITPGSARVRFQ